MNRPTLAAATLAAALCFPAHAHAQGFFKPNANNDLSLKAPPAEPAPPPAAMVAPVQPMLVIQAPAAQPQAAPPEMRMEELVEKAELRTEERLDRAEQEAARERERMQAQQAAPSVGASFDGLTSDRNR